MGETVAAIFGNDSQLQPLPGSNVRVGRDSLMWKALWEIQLASETCIMSMVQVSILKEKLTEKHIYFILGENAFVGTSYPKG